MSRVGELFISLRASTASFSKDLKRSTKITQKAAKQMGQAFKIVGAALIALGAAAAAGLGVLVKKSIDAADNLAKLSEKTGISTEALSKLEFAAEQSGINLETLSQRMVNLARRAKEGDRGVLSYRLAFDKLNISLRDSRGKLKGTEDLLLDIADRFSKMEDGTLKAAIATDIFSNQGVALIPFLNQGREGIKALTDQAERLGLVIDSKTAKAAEKFNDNLSALKSALTGLGNTIATFLLPVFARLTDRFVAFVEDGDKVKDTAREIAVSFVAIALSLNELKTRTEIIKDAVGNATDVFLEFLRAPFVGLEPTKKAWAEIFNSAEVTALRGELAAQQLVDAFFGLSKNIKQPARAVTLELEGIGKQFDELIKKNLELTQRTIQPTVSSFENLKLSSQLLAEAIAKQNAEVLDATEFLKQYGVQLGDAGKQSQELERISRDLSHVVGTAFEDAILRGEGFRAVLQGIFEDLARIAIRAAITKPLQGIFGNLFSGFGGFFQHGGTLRAGQVGIVGEGGEPELIAAGVTSSITPISKLGGVTIINKFDLRGASPGVGAEVRRALRLAAREMKALTKAEIAEASLRTA